MNAIPRPTNAERAGGWLGRVWRRFAQREARAIRWLASRGLPQSVAQTSLWIVKLAVLGVLLYAASWLLLLLVFLVAAAWVARRADLRDEDQQPRWRNGWEGYGLYRGEVRVDVGGLDDQ